MTFLAPVMLLALLLVPVAVLGAQRIERRRRARASLLVGMLGAGAASSGSSSGSGSSSSSASSSPSVASGGRSAGTRVLDRLPAVLLVSAGVVLVLALARPQATVVVPRLEGTLMLTFDVSGSMAATDVAPSRMEAARAAAHAIADARPAGVVVGVVAFSNAGMSVQAPTDDPARITAAIDRMVPAEGTSIGEGIMSTVDAIEASRAPTPAEYYSSRPPEPTPAPAPGTAADGPDDATLIVLFSDGENTDRSDPVAAAAEAAASGLRIVTVGVGTEAGQVLDLDGFQVQSRLDEATLRAIADTSGGTYHAAADGDVPDAVYGELARRLTTREEPLELTAAFAGLALLLLLAAAGLSLARTGRLP